MQSREHQKMMYVAYEDFSWNPSKYNIETMFLLNSLYFYNTFGIFNARFVKWFRM